MSAGADPYPDQVEQASTRAGETDGPEDRSYQRLLVAVVMLAVMTFGSLMTLVTVSLDLIALDLESSRATLTWMITGLMLAMAVATPLAGKLGDIHGHRRLFLFGLAGGVISTLLSAAAWDAPSVITFRVLFGLTGALVMPNAMALMMQAYSVDRRATAMGWFQFAMTGAPTIGLVIGGPLIDRVGWRIVFVGFAGVSMIALVVGAMVIRPSPRREQSDLDYWGALTLGAAVLAGLLAVTRISERFQQSLEPSGLLDPLVGLLIAICVAAIVAFIAIERRTPAPMLQLRYFRRPNFTRPMLSAAFVQFAYMGGFVVTPALLVNLYGLEVGTIALIMAPRPGVFSLASPAGGYLATRVGEKPPIVAGAVLMMLSMAAFAAASIVDPEPSMVFGIALVLVGLTLSGASAGISQPSVAALVTRSVDADDIGIANGMSQQVMFIGIVTGIQTMNVFVGDEAGATRFAATFGLGLVVAALGLLVAAGIRGTADTRPTG